MNYTGNHQKNEGALHFLILTLEKNLSDQKCPKSIELFSEKKLSDLLKC